MVLEGKGTGEGSADLSGRNDRDRSTWAGYSVRTEGADGRAKTCDCDWFDVQ